MFKAMARFCVLRSCAKSQHAHATDHSLQMRARVVCAKRWVELGKGIFENTDVSGVEREKKWSFFKSLLGELLLRPFDAQVPSVDVLSGSRRQLAS